MKPKSSKLRVGDWVEVRSKEEILSTLDSDGRLDGMPFMPEMFAFCGKRFQVYKRAHKTCDTVFPVRGRRVDRAVHLDTRCDGSAHGGCQASCLIFWKEAWLKPVSGNSLRRRCLAQPRQQSPSPVEGRSECTGPDVTAQTLRRASGARACVRLPGHATTLCDFQPLNGGIFSQYVEDYISGNVGLWRIFCGGIYFLYLLALSRPASDVGRPMRWFYDHFYPLWRGAPFPRRHGTIPDGQPTPTETLDLQPGELVRIKPYKEILNTLNTRDRNRGLYFDAEEVPYCGGTYRVLKRVTKIIHEKTGKMLEMKTPCVILDSVICQSRYSECRLFCPRSIYSYWREIWLERVGPKPSAAWVRKTE